MSETKDQARTRRRWITLAELVAIAGVLIGALTLYLSWSGRSAEQATAAKQEESAARERARLELTAKVEESGRMVTLADPKHELIDVTVAFPKALGVGVRQPVLPRIERRWFDDALLKATDGGADEREGRLPVLVIASYLDGEARRTGSAIVDIVWRTEGHLLSGRSLTIEAARLRERGGGQARVDALWARELARR